MDFCEVEVIAGGLVCMWRMVNVAAQHVYEKVGFKRVERIGGYYADGRDAYVMKKEGS